MEITLELIVFTVLALFIGVSAILAVTTRRILRAATYLLFVLFGTAGIYFQLNYSFLGAVQLLIYAGGITVLYVFSILLTSSQGDKAEDLKGYKLFVGLGAALASLGICLWITLRHDFLPSHFEHGELHVRTIGHALMSSGKYGYILPGEKKDGWFKVRGFAEKPDEEKAEALLKEGALWNCGVFCVKIGDILERTKKYGVPEDYDALCAAYESLPKISFDYEVLEKAKHLAAVEFDGYWKDLGTWDALADQMSTDTIGNVVLDDTCENTQVINELKMPVAVMGTRDLVVVAAQDGILVADKSQTANVKAVASAFDTKPMFEERRWGTLETLDDTESQGQTTLTRKICIYDGMTSSYHYHEHRDEIWTVLRGTGELILEGTKIPLSQGKAVCIRKNQRHAVKAFHDFEYIEIHVGTSSGNEDINRITFHWDEIELSHIL